MSPFRFSILIFSLVFFYTSIFANDEITPFSFSRGFVFPSLFESHLPQHAIGHLFENTARLGAGHSSQMKFAYHQNYFSYNEVEAAYLLPFKKSSIGVGYHRFYTNDLQRTARDPNANRGIAVLDTFSDVHSQIVLGAALTPSEKLSLGYRFRFLSRKLDNDSLDQFISDVALLYKLNHIFEVGGYTQNLLQGTRKWGLSKTSETLKKQLILELSATLSEFQLSISTDQDQHRLLGYWHFNSNLSISSDILFNKISSIKRHGVGLVLSVSGLSFHYNFSQLKQDFDNTQHLFGVLFQLFPSKKVIGDKQ